MENTDKKTLVMKDGTVVRPLYVQNWALGDWEALEQIKQTHNFVNIADTLRFIVRQAAGKL